MSQTIDEILQEALVSTTGGLDPDVTRVALRDFQAAIARQAKALSEVKYQRRRVEAKCPGCKTPQKFTVAAVDPDILARSSVATAKAVDTYARLTEFLAGKPDSRPQDGQRDWLRGLTDEQVRVVAGWVEANGQRRSGGA